MNLEQATLAECFEAVVTQRRSVRGFKKQVVGQALIQHVFSIAGRAPSNCNTQPWAVHVVSGGKLERLRDILPVNTMRGMTTLDYPYEPKYHGIYQERQFDAANQMYGAVGLERKDKEQRMEVFMRNYRFFGAPHVAFLFLPEHFGLREAADIGMYAQTLMLALTAHGLASCPQTSLGFHADAVREVLEVDASYKLLFGISFGYEDIDDPINNTRMGRAELSETTVFHDQ
ncbi:nitroreductase [Ketobacter alkanivorans]|uniref:Nitroreductase n=1 Tax=Ketobacter alkanivorans TaxID=1917421 RepID=A0A2K9LLM6_9GAMM|nr:nitroreductase [Ketobacter alkanivorans]AUM12375.1 nitroreductase [Ketobacter alkanivorans]